MFSIFFTRFRQNFNPRMKIFAWACLSLPGTLKSVSIEPETGRVIIPLDSILAESDPYLRDRALWQNIVDEHNRAMTPDSHDLWAQQTDIGLVTLGERLHSGHLSSVYAILQFPEWIIKFQADCSGEVRTHPLIRDFLFSNEAHAQGLAPKIHFFSPPSLLCEEKEGKCLFTISDDEFEFCQDTNGTLRYVIMDRVVGTSLHGFRWAHFGSHDGMVGLRNAAMIGMKLIDILQHLHTVAKIVHGDIHTPNVMIQIDPTTKKTELKLIDFELAFHKSDTRLPTDPVHEPGTFYHRLYSLWQLLGYAWSARDDLLKALQSIAELTQPSSFVEFEKKIQDTSADSLREWKMNGNWFVTELHDPVAAMADLSDPAKTTLYRNLEEILAIARSIGINDVIPYSELRRRFAELAQLSSPIYPTAAPPS